MLLERWKWRRKWEKMTNTRIYLFSVQAVSIYSPPSQAKCWRRQVPKLKQLVEFVLSTWRTMCQNAVLLPEIGKNEKQKQKQKQIQTNSALYFQILSVRFPKVWGVDWNKGQRDFGGWQAEQRREPWTKKWESFPFKLLNPSNNCRNECSLICAHVSIQQKERLNWV